jgi:hypothetical protein
LHIQKYRIWLVWLLIIPVISDGMYGVADALNISLPIGPGVILRGTILMIATLYILKRISMIPIGFVVFYFLIYITIIPGTLIGIASGCSIPNEVSFMSKYVYLPTMILIFLLLLRNGISLDEITRYIEYSSYISSIILLLPGLMNLQVDTYGDYAFGVKGFFKPGNEVGLALGIAILASGYRLLFVKLSLLRFSLLCLSIYAITMLGSRASLIILAGFGITIVTTTLLSRNDNHRQTIKIKMLTRISTSIVVSTLLFSALFYGYNAQKSFSYQKDKIEMLVNGAYPRQEMIASGYEYLANRPSPLILTGEGSERYMRGVVGKIHYRENNIAEVDWMDAYGSYGLLFTMTLYGFLTLTLFTASKNVILKASPLSFFLASAIFLYLTHSIFAGHALFSPQPSTIAAAYIAMSFHINWRINNNQERGTRGDFTYKDTYTRIRH